MGCPICKNPKDQSRSLEKSFGHCAIFRWQCTVCDTSYRTLESPNIFYITPDGKHKTLELESYLGELATFLEKYNYPPDQYLFVAAQALDRIYNEKRIFVKQEVIYTETARALFGLKESLARPYLEMIYPYNSRSVEEIVRSFPTAISPGVEAR